MDKRSVRPLGNTIEPVQLAEQVGIDTLRYYLLRHQRAGRDGDFAQKRLLVARDRELADGLGNLLNRVVRLIERWGEVSVFEGTGALSERLLVASKRVARSVEDFAVHAALDEIFGVIGACNEHLANGGALEGRAGRRASVVRGG